MTNRFDKTIFTIKDMITSCGLKPKSGRDKDGNGKVNIQFKEILSDLQSKGIIETHKKLKLENVNIDTYINCTFNMPIDKDPDNNNNTNFFTILHENYLEIMDRYSGKLNKLTLLEVYYYINARLSRREVITYDGKRMSNDIQVNGGKAECFYDSYGSIVKHLKITENTWNIYIKELQSMGLVYYDNIGLVKKDGRTHIANNVYVVDENELSEALKQSKLFYETNGFIVLGKKTAKEIKTINGLKGKIAQEQNSNRDTSNLESKLENLENKKAKRKELANKTKKTETKENEENWWGEKPKEVINIGYIDNSRYNYKNRPVF
ncbi:hypothetical protein [Clostridium sp. JNZ J1-5]